MTTENKETATGNKRPNFIAPWLSVRNSLEALRFYKLAFDAVETYRLDVPGGVIARLSVNGAEFWISDGQDTANPEMLGGGSIRIILTVPNPEEVLSRAIAAGASEIFPVGEAHGWRLGRIADPFGLHWEIGYHIAE
jgi:PhnB protein